MKMQKTKPKAKAIIERVHETREEGRRRLSNVNSQRNAAVAVVLLYSFPNMP